MVGGLGQPHFPGRRPHRQQAGRLDTDPEYYRPAQGFANPHVGVMGIAGRFLAGDLLPAEGQDLAGGLGSGEGGQGRQCLAAAVPAVV